MRSEAQDVAVVRLEARVVIREEQVERLAAQVWSRSWVMRREDLAAWKNELEFWEVC